IRQLFAEASAISALALQGPSLDQEALGRVLAWSRAPAAARRLVVERLSVRGARIALHGMQPLTVNADLALGPDGSVTRANLSLSDGSLHAVVVPQADGASLHVRGSRFTPPIGPGYVFENLELTATLGPRELRDIQAEGSVFGGRFKANGQVRYGGDIVV